MRDGWEQRERTDRATNEEGEMKNGGRGRGREWDDAVPRLKNAGYVDCGNNGRSAARTAW